MVAFTMSSEEIEAYKNAKVLAVDIETRDPLLTEKGPSWVANEGHILGVALACKGFKTFVPIAEQYVNSNELTGEEREKNIRDLKLILASSNIKTGANFQYDVGWLNHEGFEVNGKYADVQYAEPLLNEAADSYSLKSLTFKYLPPADQKRSDLLEAWGAERGIYKGVGSHIHEMPLQLVYDYASADADVTLKVLRRQWIQLEKQDLMELFEIENALIPILCFMRKFGVRVNYKHLVEMAYYSTIFTKDYGERLRTILKAPASFNCNSTPQLVKLLLARGVPLERRAPTENMKAKGLKVGNPVIQKEQLRVWAKSNEVYDGLSMQEFSKCIHAYRQYEKIKQFCKSYLKYMVKHGSGNEYRIHASYHPLKKSNDGGVGGGSDWGRGSGTVSGRFSSTDPNMQQVSATEVQYAEDTPEPLKNKPLRRLFIPEAGDSWVKMDYSQMEYRLMAHYASGELGDDIKRRYNEDDSLDFHAYVSSLTGFPRRTAKVANFSMAYGMRPETMSRVFGMPIAETQEIYNKMQEAAPFITESRKHFQNVAKFNGFLRTIGGRYQRVSERRPPFTLYNGLMQGSCADFMKKSMVDCWNAGIYKVCPILATVHDEQDLSMPDTKEAKEAIEEARHLMRTAYELKVTVKVDPEYGPSWGEVH